MVTRLAEAALLRSHRDERWAVTCLEFPKGLAELARDGEVMCVVIADDPRSGFPRDDPDAYSAVACTPDGELALVVHHSPPAIVVGPTGCRTSPADGLGRDCLRPAGGERLLLLSCAAFDQMPEVLADAIHTSPSTLLEQDPQDLLERIFRNVEHGAGAVIDRLPLPRTGGDGP